MSKRRRWFVLAMLLLIVGTALVEMLAGDREIYGASAMVVWGASVMCIIIVGTLVREMR